MSDAKEQPPSAAELADAYVALYPHRLWRGSHYIWTESDGSDGDNSPHYKRMDYDMLAREITEYLTEVSRDYDDNLAAPAMVKSVIEAIGHRTARDATIDDEGLAFRNGVLDEESGELVRHASHAFVTAVRPYDYDPNATCPRWLAFLDWFTSNDEDLVVTLQQWFGSCLLPEIRHEKFLWLHGRGGNGKSVLAAVMAYVITAVSYLTVKQLAAGRHHLPALIGKQLNVSMEFERFPANFVDAIKNLASGEEMEIDEKYKAVYRVRPTARLLLVSNTIPYVSDQSNGFWRRCLLVKCDAAVEEGAENLALIDELKTEASGIYNWLLAGAEDLRRLDGHIQIASKISAAVEYERTAMDPHGVYLAEELCPALSEDGWLPGESYIYPRYRSWMLQRGHQHPLTWPTFKRRLEEACPYATTVRRAWRQDNGYGVNRKIKLIRCRGYQGVMLTSELPNDLFEDHFAQKDKTNDTPPLSSPQTKAGLDQPRSTAGHRTGGADVRAGGTGGAEQNGDGGDSAPDENRPVGPMAARGHTATPASA